MVISNSYGNSHFLIYSRTASQPYLSSRSRILAGRFIWFEGISEDGVPIPFHTIILQLYISGVLSYLVREPGDRGTYRPSHFGRLGT